MTDNREVKEKTNTSKGRLAAIIFIALMVAPVIYALVKELRYSDSEKHSTVHDSTQVSTDSLK